MNYLATFPVTKTDHKLGVTSVYTVTNRSRETKEQAALWHYNSARKYVGLKPIKKLPKGIKFTPIYEEGE